MSEPALPDNPANAASNPAVTPRTTFPKPIAGRIVVPGAHPGDGHDAVSLPLDFRHDAEPDDPTAEKVHWSATATLCTVIAIAVLIAVERIGAPSGFRTFRYGVALTVVVLGLAVIASAVPNALWREGSLLAWNGLGLAIGVLGLGVLGVSSMLALPPVLVGIALTSWPHPSVADGSPEVMRGALALDTGQRVALITGLLVVPILALVEWLWLRGGRG